jgi:hypothetical protein
MTQEEKELLLKDLCARLPYGVILDIDTTDWKAPQGHIKVKIEGVGILYSDLSLTVNGSYYGNKYKPYLRSMASMTEEEYKEYMSIDNRAYSCPIDYAHIPAQERIDWLNAHHFDFRGLIERNLALEAPEGMYN